MKIQYLEFKDSIMSLYHRIIKFHPDGGDGIIYEWIEYDGCGIEKINDEEGWDEDFLEDFEIRGDRMILR
jgi:hypothetical protein